MMNRFTIRAFTTLALAMMVGQVSAQDSVTLNKKTRRGSKLVGTIKSVSRTGLVMETNGGTREIPANEIERIGLAGEPAGLRQGRSSFYSGQYEQAQESLDSVRLPGSANSILKQEAAFYRAATLANLALRGSGSAREAVSLLRAFVRNGDTRNSIHFYDAVELMGDLALMVGSYENATVYYKQLAKAPWPDYRIKSAVLEGNSLRAEGKHEEAMKRYEAALQINSNEPEALRQQTFASIGQAACAAEAGDTQAALQTLEEVIAKNDAADGELFARAYLAQGAAHRKANRPLDAVLAYLHVDLLFFNQRDAHAEALYFLSQLWPEVNNPDRGVQARSLLKARYGSTGWAKKS